jgi:peptide/nickel transport system permease protein
VHDPLEQSGSRDLVPPQRIHFFDGIRPTRPYVYGLNRVRNPETFQVEYKADESEKYPIRLFTRGHEYSDRGRS